MTRVGIIGGGALGTAMACVLRPSQHETALRAIITTGDLARATVDRAPAPLPLPPRDDRAQRACIDDSKMTTVDFDEPSLQQARQHATDGLELESQESADLFARHP